MLQLLVRIATIVAMITPGIISLGCGGPPNCGDGYVQNGNVCDDIDECTAGTDNCHGSATCTNTSGAFTCACRPGFTGIGIDCDDVDECSLGTDDCDQNAVCSNSNGGFTCACKTGYEGTGTSCSPAQCAATCATTGGECVKNDTCVCPTGQTFNAAIGCNGASNACSPACGLFSSCRQVLSGLRCVCDDGFDDLDEASPTIATCVPRRANGPDCMRPVPDMTQGTTDPFTLCGRFTGAAAPDPSFDVNNTFDLRGTVSVQPQPPAPLSGNGFILELRRL